MSNELETLDTYATVFEYAWTWGLFSELALSLFLQENNLCLLFWTFLEKNVQLKNFKGCLVAVLENSFLLSRTKTSENTFCCSPCFSFEKDLFSKNN